MLARVDLGPTDAVVHVQGLDGREPARAYGPLRLDVGREGLTQQLLVPAGLPVPPTWEPMGYIPYGTDRPWPEHWAGVLSDVAMYGSALREEPYALRYERVELLGSGDQREASIVVVPADRSGPRFVTLIPIPVPQLQHDEVVGVGFSIREWITDGEGTAEGEVRTKRFR